MVATEENKHSNRQHEDKSKVIQKYREHVGDCHLANGLSITFRIGKEYRDATHAPAGRNDINKVCRSNQKRQPINSIVHSKDAIERLKYQTRYSKPGNLNQNSQKDKPKVSLLQSVNNTLKFTKA